MFKRVSLLKFFICCGLGAAISWGLCGTCLAAPVELLFKEDFESPLDRAWKPFPKFSGETSYRIFRDGTNSVLEARAAATGSGLSMEKHLRLAPGSVVEWRWKIDRVPVKGLDTKISGFDHAARIFLAFHTFVGPPRSINYVWANQTPVGQTFSHPNSKRARFLVLETGNGKGGQWISEKRDIVADYRKLFGEDPPELVGIGLITDGDDTKETVVGYYDDLRIYR